MPWIKQTDEDGRPQWVTTAGVDPQTGQPNYVVSSIPPDANGWVRTWVGEEHIGYREEWVSGDGVRSPVPPIAAGVNWWQDPANFVTPGDANSFGTVRNPATGQVEKMGETFGPGGVQVGFLPESEARNFLTDPSASFLTENQGKHGERGC